MVSPESASQAAAHALGGLPTQENRFIAVGTPLGVDRLLLRAFTYVEELGEPFELALDLLSLDHNISFKDIVGQNVTVRLNLPGSEEPRYFNGYVRRFSQVPAPGRYAVYRAEVVPWIWFLSLCSDCRIFQQRTVPEIIKQIIQEHGYSDIEDRLTGTYRQWDYCVQYRETDLNFIHRLMEQEGIYYFFLHENGKHTLVLCDSPGCHETYPGYETLTYLAGLGGTRSERIFSLEVSQKVCPGVFAHNDFDFKNPRKSLLASSNIERDYAPSRFELYDYPGEYTDFNDGERYARTRIESYQTEFETIDARANARGIACGYKFTLTGHPREDINKDYLVTNVTVEAATDAYESQSAGLQECTLAFKAIDAATTFRPQRNTPKPLIQGPQTAIVVGPAGEEIYTDEFGRVKVQFHWDRRSKADENSSCWIRVAQLWAGKKWGAMFIPRIGQEVIVEFLEGDPDRPIITGRVYNGEEMPPYELPAEKTKSTVKTNSSPDGGGFNEIRFEDKKGKEQLFIHAERNKDERVGSTSKEYVGYDRHLVVKHDQFEKVEGDKHLTVNGDHNEQVDGTISITAGMDRQEKTTMNYAHEAGMEVHIKAGMNVVIEAGVSITLKAGASFITIGPGPIYISGTPTFINSGGSPGSGSGASPEAPEEAVEAATGKPGETDKAPKKPKPPKPATYSAQAKVLKQAAQDGTPFCEQCAAAAQQQQAQTRANLLKAQHDAATGAIKNIRR